MPLSSVTDAYGTGGGAACGCGAASCPGATAARPAITSALIEQNAISRGDIRRHGLSRENRDRVTKHECRRQISRGKFDMGLLNCVCSFCHNILVEFDVAGKLRENHKAAPIEQAAIAPLS